MVRIQMILSIAVLALALTAPASAQDTPPENPLLEMLRFVPDTPDNRQWLTYGDMAAWHKSWNVPRINSLNELENLSRDQHAYWFYISGQQTIVPDVLGVNYLNVDDMRGVYGFDIFSADRFLQAGSPPDWITVVDTNVDSARIADALEFAGYTAVVLDKGATLYSIRGDYEIDLKSETRVGQLGNLNRIALLDRGQVVIGKATAPVTDALLASHGEAPSLADDPSYIAAVKSLDDPALADTGDLVGAILLDHAQLDNQDAVLGNIPANIADQLLQPYQVVPLPAYNLVAFVTRHSDGATHLILDVVFPEGTDAKVAANILADRMKNYTSLRTRQSLNDRWTFELAAGTKIGGLPVALVVMKVDDPPPTPEGQDLPSTGVLSWLQMVEARDTAYLISQP